MTTIITEIYDALREAGASEERSRAAAQTLLAYDDRFARIDDRFSQLDRQTDAVHAQFSGVRALIELVRGEIRDAKTELKGEARDTKTELKGDIRLLQWQLGMLIAGVVSLVLKAFFTGP